MRAAAIVDRLPRRARPRARRLLRRSPRPRLLNDEYVDWLGRLNAGTQDRGNPYLLDLAVRSAPPAPMLEIGSLCGLSAATISYLQRKHGRCVPLFCCDSWVLESAEQPLPAAAPVTRAEMRAHALESFQRAMLRFSAERLPFAIEASSQEFLRDWEGRRRVRDVFGRGVRLGGPLGFCLVDGEHSARGSREDFDGCDRHLVAGGLILFAGSGDHTPWPVRAVVREAIAQGRYEVVARNPNYLLRKLS
jgi:hypothetical protein